MQYTFEILGVSPVLYLFNQQQEVALKKPRPQVEYLGTHKCTLDAFIESIETVPLNQGWDLERMVNTVVDFWMNNADSIKYWQSRLEDAGNASILISRVADIKSLQAEFEFLLGKNR